MKFVYFLLFLTCLQLANAGTLVIQPRVPWAPVFDPSVCSNEIDSYIRNKYYYYLPFAQLCYIAQIDYKGGFLFIHQYKNYIGTFMAITRYEIPRGKINVVTFVRLGEGAPDMESLFHPMVIDPTALYINLGEGEYHYPIRDQPSVPIWSESYARQTFYSSQSAAELAAARCVGLDVQARKNYDHYLRGAVILSESNSAFGSYCYCMNTYVNLMGIWQVIGKYTPFGIEITTFVRLGNGYDPSRVEKCVPYPSFDSWTF